MIKSGIMRWAEHVARMGERRDVYRILLGKREGNRTFGKPRCRWGIKLRRISTKWDGAWTGSIWFRIRTGGGL